MNLEIQGQVCPKCGIGGIHACPGKPIPPMTPEEEVRLRSALDQIFRAENNLLETTRIPKPLVVLEDSRVKFIEEYMGINYPSSLTRYGQFLDGLARRSSGEEYRARRDTYLNNWAEKHGV